MPRYQYKVVPLDLRSSKKPSPKEAAELLEALINSNAAGGWEFDQLVGVDVHSLPGCAAFLGGWAGKAAQFDQVIFRRPLGSPHAP
jgi:hypothetical protein